MKMRKIIPVLAAIGAIALLPACDKENCNPGGGVNDCICTKEYAPVCGSDGKTYGNACEARCNGITNYTLGKCQAD